MSTRRKLKRAGKARTGGPARPPAPSHDPARLKRQLESERFRVAGSEALWQSLLGWTAARRERIWLVQALHDAARRETSSPPAPASVRAQFAAHSPEGAARLDDASIATAVDLFRDALGEHRAEPAPVFHYLESFCARLQLGEATAESLRDDWDVWTRLELASAPRRALMEELAKTERAAMELKEVTASEPVEAIAAVARILWTALAYGDEATFDRIRAFASEWLARPQRVSPP